MWFNVCKMWDRNVLRATLPYHPPFVSKLSFISLPLVLHILYFNHYRKTDSFNSEAFQNASKDSIWNLHGSVSNKASHD
jgi:hypothetical protein